jgi:hypothetical protein
MEKLIEEIGDISKAIRDINNLPDQLCNLLCEMLICVVGVLGGIGIVIYLFYRG